MQNNDLLKDFSFSKLYEETIKWLNKRFIRKERDRELDIFTLEVCE